MTIAKHFHYIVPVWGEKYTSQFTQVCLPMLMSMGNLDCANIIEKDEFIIVTTWNDRCRIVKSSSYQKLSQKIKVEFILIDGLVDLENTHQAMSCCYAFAMKRDKVIPNYTYFVFLTPDSFWSIGSFNNLLQLRDSNYKVVMAMGLRVNAEAMSQELLGLLDDSNNDMDKNLNLDIVPLVIKNLHLISESFDLLSRNGFMNQWPSNLYWINRDVNQIVAHCFHLHPLMVQAPQDSARIGDTLDGKFIENLKYSFSDFYVLQEKYFGIELTSIEKDWGCTLMPASLSKIIWFSHLYANKFHIHFFKHRIIIGPTVDINPSLGALISKYVDEILRHRNSKLYNYKIKFTYLCKRFFIRKNVLARIYRKTVTKVANLFNYKYIV